MQATDICALMILQSLRSLFGGKSQSEPQLAAAHLHDHGFAVLRGVLSYQECDAVIASFDDYVVEHADEAATFRLPTNRHSRLTNLHLVSDAARSAISKPRIMQALDAFFEDKAFVATSLFFEQSSEQAIHRDSPFFHTRPRNLFAGVWLALEDVHPDSGPLRYFPGAHTLKVDPGTAPSHDAILATYYEYSARLIDAIKQNGFAEHIAMIKKGDCFIWHPELPHGGTPILSPGRTRKSIVFHCAPEAETMYGWEEFFSVVPFDARENAKCELSTSRRMLVHSRPSFARND